MTSVHYDKKSLLLETGLTIFATNGFTNVGLAELLKKAGIPKGSFYYYFNSKEEYGVEVIQHYIQNYTARLAALFEEEHLYGKQRLLRYWQEWQITQCSNNYEGRCLIVKLSSEVTDFSEPMRKAFCIGTQQILILITNVILAGQKDGSIPQQLTADKAAQQLYQQWLGASLLVKIQKNTFPFTSAFEFTHSLFASS